MTNLIKRNHLNVLDAIDEFTDKFLDKAVEVLNNDKKNRLYNKNSTINGIPYVFLYYYVPVKYQYDKEYSFTQEVETSCHKIWNFKDGINQEWAINAVAEVLDICNYNGKSNPKLTFVCIPASTIGSNNQRFKYFASAICERSCLENGFNHINIIKEKTPKHISGIESETELEIDPVFFAGKDIILFDDVVTKGHSMQKLMQKLQAVNAKTVLCLSLGKTYFPPVTTINPINPYTGNHLLVAPQEQTDNCITIDSTKPAFPSRSSYSSDSYDTANSSNSGSAFGSTSKPNVGSVFGSASKPNAGSAFGSTSKPNVGSVSVSASKPNVGSVSVSASKPNVGSVSVSASASKPNIGSVSVSASKPNIGSVSVSASKPNVGSAFGSTSKPNVGSAFGSASKPNVGSVFGSASSSVHADINKNTGYQPYEHKEPTGAEILKKLQSTNNVKEVIKRIESLNNNELQTVLQYLDDNKINTKSNSNSDNPVTYTKSSSSKGAGAYTSGNSGKSNAGSVSVDINKNTGYYPSKHREQIGAGILKELQSLNDVKEVAKRIDNLSNNELQTVLQYLDDNKTNTKSNSNSDTLCLRIKP